MRTKTFLSEGTLDPVSLYERLTLTKGRENTLMLESADVHTKAGQKSFLMIEAAIKIQATKEQVRIEALTSFGQGMLAQIKGIDGFIEKTRDLKSIVYAPQPQTHEGDLTNQLHQKNVLDALRKLISLYSRGDPEQSASNFLLAGIFSYDLIDHFESLPAAMADPCQFPDYVFWLPETFVTIDHIRCQTRIVSHFFDEPSHLLNEAQTQIDRLLNAKEQKKQEAHERLLFSETVSVDVEDGEYADLVSKLKEHVVCGDVFQIVPSRTFTMPCTNSLLAYKKLKKINPSPYMYYVVAEGFELCGASPETFIKLNGATRELEVKPIAGTRKRGTLADGAIDAELDSRLEAELRLDTKELAEHMMLVDLARNDIARVSKIGTRRVHSLLGVERFSHVMHLVSHVKGELREGLDGLHAYQASLNMGTLVGAPKVKAAEILRKYEKSKRGSYGGAVGYFDASGNFDTAIIIRSAFIQNGIAHVRAGAGVVYDSVPMEEAAETRNKASSVMLALANAKMEGDK